MESTAVVARAPNNKIITPSIINLVRIVSHFRKYTNNF